MTEDTKRALAAINPLAEILGVKVQVYDNLLYLNGQMIGISCNSTWATCMEFIGYVFLNIYCEEKLLQISKGAKDRIQRYWIL